MTASAMPPPEFSFPIDLDDLSETGASYELSADSAVRAALAKRFGLLSLDRFETKLVVAWVKRGKVLSVAGELSADVVQSCVVTLEPVPSRVDERFDLTFARDIDSAAEFVDPDEAEPLEGDMLDIGEVVSEELSLALDPYPRSPDIDPASIHLGPGASYSSEEDTDREPEPGNRPFEVLARLRRKH